MKLPARTGRIHAAASPRVKVLLGPLNGSRRERIERLAVDLAREWTEDNSTFS